MTRRPPPPALDPAEIALFLDYDGTLIPYAVAAPGRPRADPTLPPLLETLIDETGGATALVTGRGVAELDALIAPLRLPVSGTHGAELRRDAEGPTEVLFRSDDVDAVEAEVRAFAGDAAGLRVERKPMTVVLHFHDRLDLEPEIVARARLIGEDRPDVVPQLGNGIVEFKPAGADKGFGIARLMETPPFSDRRPVFVGDDIPDEAGFAVVEALGGVTIRVGTGASRARHGLADAAAVRVWLRDLAGGEPTG